MPYNDRKTTDSGGADSMSWAKSGGHSTAEYHDLVFICYKHVQKN